MGVQFCAFDLLTRTKIKNDQLIFTTVNPKASQSFHEPKHDWKSGRLSNPRVFSAPASPVKICRNHNRCCSVSVSRQIEKVAQFIQAVEGSFVAVVVLVLILTYLIHTYLQKRTKTFPDQDTIINTSNEHNLRLSTPTRRSYPSLEISPPLNLITRVTARWTSASPLPRSAYGCHAGSTFLLVAWTCENSVERIQVFNWSLIFETVLFFNKTK